MALSSGMGISAFKRLKSIFGKQVTLQYMSQTFDEDTGDEVDAVDDTKLIIAIFDMDNDVSIERGDGRHSIGINLVYIDGDVTVNKFDRLVDSSNTYQIEDIRKGVGSGDTIYKALVVNQLI